MAGLFSYISPQIYILIINLKPNLRSIFISQSIPFPPQIRRCNRVCEHNLFIPIDIESSRDGLGKLNPDLLRCIANKVGDTINFIRFRVMCRHWRSVVHPGDLPPQLPCVLLSCNHKLINGKPSSDLRFFSLYSNKTYSLPNSEVKGILSSSSKTGYLCSSLKSLFHPLTKAQILLPRDACCYGCADFPLNLPVDLILIQLNKA